jgi:hypothetical protein
VTRPPAARAPPPVLLSPSLPCRARGALPSCLINLPPERTPSSAPTLCRARALPAPPRVCRAPQRMASARPCATLLRPPPLGNKSAFLNSSRHPHPAPVCTNGTVQHPACPAAAADQSPRHEAGCTSRWTHVARTVSVARRGAASAWWCDVRVEGVMWGLGREGRTPPKHLHSFH